MEKPLIEIERDRKLDVLKALGITFVLIWHLQPIKFIVDNQTHIVVVVLANIVMDLHLQLFLTAVPLFYIVSLYIFFQNANFKYLKKRIIRLIKIYFFWSIFQNIFFIIATRKLPDWSWEIITGLQPSLPLVGDSVFYFLFNLIFLTILAFFYQNQSNKLRPIVSCLIMIFSLCYFEALSLLNLNLPYHWLINFIIYVPIAFYLVNYQDRILDFKFYYLVAYILFSLHDIHLRTSSYYLSIYGRISIICGTLTIFCFIYSLKNIKKNLLVQKLAKYSLGLFALHKYWQYLFFLLVQYYQLGIVPGIFGIPLNVIFLIEVFWVLLLTTLSIYVLKSTSFKQFVT